MAKRKRSLNDTASSRSRKSRASQTTTTDPTLEGPPPPIEPVVPHYPYSSDSGIPLSDTVPDVSLLEQPLSLKESFSLSHSLAQSRNKWLSGAMFTKYWTRPPRGRKLQEGEVNAREKMSKLCECVMVIGPHIFETKLFLVKDEETDSKTDTEQENLSKPTGSTSGVETDNLAEPIVQNSNDKTTDSSGPHNIDHNKDTSIVKSSNDLNSALPLNHQQRVNSSEDSSKAIETDKPKDPVRDQESMATDPSLNIDTKKTTPSDKAPNNTTIEPTPSSITTKSTTDNHSNTNTTGRQSLQSVITSSAETAKESASTQPVSLPDSSPKPINTTPLNTNSDSKKSAFTDTFLAPGSSTSGANSSLSSSNILKATSSSNTINTVSQATPASSSSIKPNSALISTPKSATNSSDPKTTKLTTTAKPAPANANSSNTNSISSNHENVQTILKLQAIARINLSLNSLMKIVASGHGTHEQISEFQGYINRVKTIELEDIPKYFTPDGPKTSLDTQKGPISSSTPKPVPKPRIPSIPSSSQGLTSNLSSSSASTPHKLDTKQIKAPRIPKTPRTPKTPKAPKEKKSREPKTAKRKYDDKPKSTVGRKKKDPSKPKSPYVSKKQQRRVTIVFEFKDNPADRYIIPKNSIIEILPTNEVLVSFFLTFPEGGRSATTKVLPPGNMKMVKSEGESSFQDGSKPSELNNQAISKPEDQSTTSSQSPQPPQDNPNKQLNDTLDNSRSVSQDPGSLQKELYYPLTVTIRDIPVKSLPILERSVHKESEVNKYMKDVLEHGTRAKDWWVWFQIDQRDEELLEKLIQPARPPENMFVPARVRVYKSKKKSKSGASKNKDEESHGKDEEEEDEDSQVKQESTDTSTINNFTSNTVSQDVDMIDFNSNNAKDHSFAQSTPTSVIDTTLLNHKSDAVSHSSSQPPAIGQPKVEAVGFDIDNMQSDKMKASSLLAEREADEFLNIPEDEPPVGIN